MNMTQVQTQTQTHTADTDTHTMAPDVLHYVKRVLMRYDMSSYQDYFEFAEPI